MDTHILETLFAVIKSRRGSSPDESYVAGLLDQGTEAISRKVMEEAFETSLEAFKNDPAHLASESADLLFHLMVLWADQGIAPEDVWHVLESRFGTSGHAEKAGRTD